MALFSGSAAVPKIPEAAASLLPSGRTEIKLAALQLRIVAPLALTDEKRAGVFFRIVRLGREIENAPAVN